MYKGTEADFKLIFEVSDKHRQADPKSCWGKITQELNMIFEESLISSQWRRQYYLGKERIVKYGSPIKRMESAVINKLVAEPKKELTVSEQKQKLRNYLTKPKTMVDISKFMKLDEIYITGLIQSLALDGYLITHNGYEQTYVVNKKAVVESQTYNHSIGDTKEFEFVVVSCSHWGSKKQQKSFTEYVYDEAERRGIKDVYHCGDIVDGYYKNRPEQIFELIPGVIGGDEQVEYVVRNWPHKEGITTHLILGNHDETHIKNGGFNIGMAIVRGRKDIGYNDFEYLGIGHAPIQLTPNCRMDIFHPLDGSSYAISYSGQKYMDSISGGDKPNILFVGHHHKALYFPYRNIHYFEVPSMMAQSSWMKRKRIANESGAWFVKLTVDEQGTIVRIIPEHVKQYKFLENDY